MSTRTQPPEAPELYGMIARTLESLVRRCESGDDAALEVLLALERELPDYVRRGGRALHDHLSWAEIAQVTGTTRQAAAERFSR